MKKLCFLSLLLITFETAFPQFVFRNNRLPGKISIVDHTLIADVGQQQLDVQIVRHKRSNLPFKALKGPAGNLGFTDHTYWVKFQLHNASEKSLLYYLETAEPVTDNINLFLFKKDNSFIRQQSGDNLAFTKRSVAFRKSVFQIQLEPGERKEALMEVKNDGEKNNLPLNLISQEEFLKVTYHDQLIMGIFYGILLIITITYLFFYFALKEPIFLYYTLYVGFVGLCQFSLDGFFHQYIDQSNSWLTLHMVIISAIGGSYFFGKYSELVLNIKQNSYTIHIAYRILYILLGIILTAVVLFPSFLRFSYPSVNLLTLAGMLLIVVSILMLIIKKQPLDLFYTLGILVLFVCFTLAIMLNFGLITSFTIENITKPAIGLEIMALSLSMANRIRVLKSKKEELQAVALQKSQEMNEVKTFFLSNMSHELRTPLNAILGLANNLRSESSDEAVKVSCDGIKSAAFNLISSVNDIMDFSKIEKGDIRLDHIRFSPFDILQKARRNHGAIALSKGLEFNYASNIKADEQVMGDPERLQQIINNVLSNAIKFTVTGSVSFQAEAANREDGQLELKLTVRDTGIGITADKLASVFEMFSQVDISDKRKFGGFGIGLCVVNALVNLHKGEINLSSQVNEGTTCTVSLTYPAILNEEKAVNLFPADSYDLLGKHILVVEDNPMNQMVIKMMMKKWLNTTLSFAGNGAESIEVLKNAEIDLILMDLQMPVMDGYEATEAIRKGFAGQNYVLIPIIVVTADVMQATRDRIVELGANDFMTKPVDQKILYQKITTLLS